MNDDETELETITDEPETRTPAEQIADLIEPTLETTPDLAGDEDEDQEPALETTEDGDQDDDDDAPEIDFALKVAMPDGLETKTVGELKDFYRENQDWETARDDWETTRADQANQQMVVRNRLVRLAQQLGDTKPEALNEILAAEAFDAKKQQNLLLQVYPEWADSEVRKTASVGMLATLKEYGFSEGDFFAIPDHRQIKLVNDYTNLLAKTRKAKARLESVEVIPPKGQKPVPRKRTTPKVEQDKLIEKAKHGGQADKDRAIASLISG